MKRIARILLPLLAVLAICSCASFQDIKMTGCELVSVSPRGLSAVDAMIDVGIDNPTVQVTLTQMTATVKMDGAPCLHVTADDVTLEPRTSTTYSIALHGVIDSEFNPFMLLSLFSGQDYLEHLTADIRFRGVLKSGLGKDFEYIDLPLQDLLDQI